MGNAWTTPTCAPPDDYFTTNPFEPLRLQVLLLGQLRRGPTDEVFIKVGAGDRITGATVGGEDAWVMLGPRLLPTAASPQRPRDPRTDFDKPETVSEAVGSIYLDHIVVRHVIAAVFNGVIHEFDSVDEAARLRSAVKSKRRLRVADIVETLGCAVGDPRLSPPQAGHHKPVRAHFTVEAMTDHYRHPSIGFGKRSWTAARVRAPGPPNSASTLPSSRATGGGMEARVSCATCATWT